VSNTPAARLARVKLQHRDWTITRQEGRHTIGYHAQRDTADGVETIDAVSLSDLENELNQRTRT
jgi:hypothetical protein